MIDINKKSFSIGLLLAASFLGVLFLIFMPVFGEGKNGLDYADDMFNKLSKGSSYFIPKLMTENERFKGRQFAVSIKMDKPDDKPGDAEKRAEAAAKLVGPAGAKAEVIGAELKIEGDLGKVIGSALADSDAMYHNDGAKIKAKYTTDDEKKMFRQWHNIFVRMDKAFKKEGKIEEAKIVSDVMKKAVETAYNYYKIEPQQVADKAVLMTGLLVFYVVYTMWWGFAIFYIFEGIGLTMKKAKVKKEV
jgi:hypothetical protein